MTKDLLKTHLIIIDPQNDFCDSKGSLFVGGADKDMNKLSKMINRIGHKLDDIHVTMDSHHLIDVAHPIMWIDSKGNHPTPFTIITVNDLKSGKWTTTNPMFQSRMISYCETLEKNSRYPLCIWPPHCLIGSWGHNIYPELYEAITKWEESCFAMVDYVTKGSNIWTEHYSAVQADVPDATDPGTMLNTRLIQTLQEADIILIAGEALSHCVANTIRDIANNFGEENIKKFLLLEDCCSSVTGFDQLGIDFIKEMTKRGMKISKSTEFMK
jgi:nicotinamidase-related amidase